MASYYARLDENNVVTEILAVNDAGVYNADGSDNEPAGAAFFQRLLNTTDRFLHTKYDGSLRKNYAGIGFTYDDARDAFIPPRPTYPSWRLNEFSCQWEAPAPYPDDGKVYGWNEDLKVWEAQ